MHAEGWRARATTGISAVPRQRNHPIRPSQANPGVYGLCRSRFAPSGRLDVDVEPHRLEQYVRCFLRCGCNLLCSGSELACAHHVNDNLMLRSHRNQWHFKIIDAGVVNVRSVLER